VFWGGKGDFQKGKAIASASPKVGPLFVWPGAVSCLYFGIHARGKILQGEEKPRPRGENRGTHYKIGKKTKPQKKTSGMYLLESLRETSSDVNENRRKKGETISSLISKKNGGGIGWGDKKNGENALVFLPSLFLTPREKKGRESAKREDFWEKEKAFLKPLKRQRNGSKRKKKKKTKKERETNGLRGSGNI